MTPYKHCILLCFLSLRLLSSPTLAVAQSGLSDTGVLSDEEAMFFQDIPSVYSASKYEQKVSEAPSSVSIVTAAEIKKYGYRTLAEILGSLRGFYTSSDRNYDRVGVRGFARAGDYNNRVLLLVDGMRMNESIFNSAPVGTDFPVDIELIDRVEVIRGPSSSLYGTNAFFGVINVITKRGRDLKGWELGTEAGSFHSYKGRLTYGNKFQNGLEVLLSGSAYDSEGDRRLFFKEFGDPSTNNGFAKNSDDDRSYRFFTKLAYKDFTLLGGHARRKKTIPTAPFGAAFNDSRTQTIDEYSYIDLKYEHTFANQLHVLSRLGYNRYYINGDYVYDITEPGDETSTFTINKDKAIGEWLGGEIQFTTSAWNAHRVTWGGDFRYNLRQHQWNYDAEPFIPYLNDSRSSHLWALFIQDEYSILDNLILNVGVRYDRYSSFGGTLNPRAALIYSFSKATTLKLLYGEAFRAPNQFELFYHDGETSIKPGQGLQPETIRTYEFVIEQTFGERLRSVLSSYYYTVDNIITQHEDPADGLLVYRNGEDVEAFGIEAELEGKWRGFTGRVSYAWQETKKKNGGRRMANSPTHMAKLNLIAPLWRDHLFAGFETQYISSRQTLAGTSTNDMFLTNLTLFHQSFFPGLELSASIYNLFDQRYGHPGSGEHRQAEIPQNGLTFGVRIQYAY